MPRKLTEDEIQKQKDLMYHAGVELIRKKGIQDITLNDITEATQMAKGSFYKYYKSKELYLYEVIKRNEAYFFTKIVSEKDIEKTFEAIALSNDFLFVCILPEDLTYLLSRLPEEYQHMEQIKSQTNFQIISEKLGIQMTEENYGTLSYLMDGLQAILRSHGNYGEAGRKRAVRMLVEDISAFFREETI